MHRLVERCKSTVMERNIELELTAEVKCRSRLDRVTPGDTFRRRDLGHVLWLEFGAPGTAVGFLCHCCPGREDRCWKRRWEFGDSCWYIFSASYRYTGCMLVTPRSHLDRIYILGSDVPLVPDIRTWDRLDDRDFPSRHPHCKHSPNPTTKFPGTCSIPRNEVAPSIPP